MMGIGFPELMIILVIIMIIFGAGKLPEIGSAFGNSIKNFKKSMKDAEEIQEATNLEDSGDSNSSQTDDLNDSETSEGEANKDAAPSQETKEN
ncbi:MAG: twin-arginine translocase TatA/TatE family subunit [Nitrospina sp.]|jgi:sec-independent protein translocase protein TatA|nr:twin-arginine translocase TatA/TatE family subunit [Nitrospina sp.]MBT4128519.1 twin-arginine translocase TatA/TatE family subunit [Nitrospina sp.]MBT4260658.1 twin-arginine translocase TatA/TatE family subunit [Nitrospina sp.]MBT5258942.1 twin-arginine translocase TatA/TatE family subunit [Nitrospina sp.]MBT5968472.1 twin-arginine translocase TatA/TatE family subunit [Nitrospina sp.]|tara:strand:+ start:12626 stop:12904 length:279 start_codon:yes stop_codon:yes gene_type:complete